MDIKKKAVHGVAWTIGQRFGTQIVSFSVFLVLSRLLDPKDFGLVSMATAFTVLVDSFIDQGFSQALIQRVEVDRRHFDTAFWTVIVFGLSFTAISVLGAGAIATVFNEPGVTEVLTWLSISILLSALGKTQQSILQRKLAFDKLAISTLCAELVGGAFGVFLAFRGLGVWSLVGRNLSRDFTVMVILWMVSDWRPGFRFSIIYFKQLFPFGASIVGNRLMEYLNRYADRFLIGSMLGATALGHYTIGSRLFQLMLSLFLGSISSVSFPVFSKLQGSIERMQKAFYKVIRFAGFISIPTFIGMSLVASNIVITLFGQKWSLSIPVMQMFSLLGIVEVVNYISSSFLIASGRASWKFGLTTVNTFAGVFAIIITIRWGIAAIAAAQALRGYLLLPLTFLAIRLASGIRWRQVVFQFKPSIIGSTTLIVVILFLRRLLSDQLPVSVMLIIYIVSACCIYFLVIACFYPSILNELREYTYLLFSYTRDDAEVPRDDGFGKSIVYTIRKFKDKHG